MIEILLIVLGVYLLTVAITWYPLVADMTNAFDDVWPDIERFREYTSTNDLIIGTFFALIPGVNVIFVMIFMLGSVMSNGHYTYPLRRRK
jgi:hypothetical protein